MHPYPALRTGLFIVQPLSGVCNLQPVLPLNLQFGNDDGKLATCNLQLAPLNHSPRLTTPDRSGQAAELPTLCSKPTQTCTLHPAPCTLQLTKWKKSLISLPFRGCTKNIGISLRRIAWFLALATCFLNFIAKSLISGIIHEEPC